MPNVHKPSDNDRRAAVALFDAIGIEEAASRTGWSKQAVAKWAASDKYRTPAPDAGIDFTAENWQEHLADVLRQVAVSAASRELQLSAMADGNLANRIRTTAVHDVQLLTGKATERTEAVEVKQSDAVKLADELAKRRASHAPHAKPSLVKPA